MSDLMREEFEAWYIQKANKDTGMCMSMADIAEKRGSNGDYAAYGYMHGCWVGWQASRESRVVELPADAHLSRDGLDENYLAGDMRDQIVEAIHAAGVKTK